ncbi:MAG TPA: hypothetical protein VLT81_18120, partial [Chondromyces sp.]|nr:hypothetical protein [Chondromyces sp.]
MVSRTDLSNFTQETRFFIAGILTSRRQNGILLTKESRVSALSCIIPDRPMDFAGDPMKIARKLVSGAGLCIAFLIGASVAAADEPRFSLELEVGPTWQSRNNVQIPNDATGTRFSLEELVGSGPWAAGRLYFTWNFKPRHSFRLLAAPLSYTETGVFDESVDFAGASYEPGAPVNATYQFNSWRIGYLWRFKEGDRWKLWVGFTAKVRDAKIELAQGETTSRDTDVGFVPLLAFIADYRLSDRWHAVFDFEGLAGGPGRAFDVS